MTNTQPGANKDQPRALELGTETHTCNSSASRKAERETGGLRVQGLPGLHSALQLKLLTDNSKNK